jgi:hypothetical protein
VFLCIDGPPNALHGILHIRQQKGIFQLRQSRFKKYCGIFRGVESARYQHVANRSRNFQCRDQNSDHFQIGRSNFPFFLRNTHYSNNSL